MCHSSCFLDEHALNACVHLHSLRLTYNYISICFYWVYGIVFNEGERLRVIRRSRVQALEIGSPFTVVTLLHIRGRVPLRSGGHGFFSQ